VWTELFQRYLEVSMPTPFILPKPLSECSSAEIERVVWTSQAGLIMPRSFMAGQPHSLDIPNTRAIELEIIPGGRWLLAGCADGTVWSYDLDALSSPESNSSNEARSPRLLLEPPVPEGTHKRVASVQFSVDYTSEQVNSNNADNFKALEHFNIAVVVTYRAHHAVVHPKSFQIWRVHAKTGAENLTTILQAQECLSSFSEDAEDVVDSISLHGNHVAYCLALSVQIIIVDWRSLNGKQAGIDSDFMRWFLRSARYTDRAIPVIHF
jgi:hypothetical protein